MFDNILPSEFWDNRLAATRPLLDVKDSRIPEHPNQVEFIAKWFDAYHRGPQVPWNQVSPGLLPVRDCADSMAFVQVERQVSAELRVPSLDAALDRLLDDEEEGVEEGRRGRDEQSPGQTEEPAPLAEAATTQARLTSANMHPVNAVSNRARALQESRDEVERISQRRERISRDLPEIEAELRTSRRHQMEITRNTRTAQQLERVFGTRDEIRQQGADYVSPVASLFASAYERHRVAEEVRAEERRADDSASQHRQILDQMNHYRRMNRRHALYNLRSQAGSRGQSMPSEEANVEGAEESSSTSSGDEETADLQTLDNDDRPPPVADEDLRVQLDCKVCFSQRADTAVLPCGHLIMCSFCSAIAIPTKSNDRTQPLARNSPCPLCRKAVKKIVRIYLS